MVATTQPAVRHFTSEITSTIAACFPFEETGYRDHIEKEINNEDIVLCFPVLMGKEHDETYDH